MSNVFYDMKNYTGHDKMKDLIDQNDFVFERLSQMHSDDVSRDSRIKMGAYEDGLEDVPLGV